MCDLPRSVCSCKPCQPALDTQDFMSGMKASPWGARLMALPSAFGCLERYRLETFLRSACLGWLWQTPHSNAGYLGVSTLHIAKIHSLDGNSFRHHNFSCDIIQRALKRSYWVSSDTRHCCLRPLRGRHAYKSLPEVGPARLLAAMLGDLGVSTLRSIKTMTQFSSLSGASNQPCCLLQCSGTTHECVFDALLFSSSYRPVGKPVSHHVVTRPAFFSSSFLDHHTGHPACHDARILLMSASPMPSEFFHRRFNLLETCSL
jgi:hypothetical protein